MLKDFLLRAQSGGAWRVIRVGADLSLEELHEVLQVSMGADDALPFQVDLPSRGSSLRESLTEVQDFRFENEQREIQVSLLRGYSDSAHYPKVLAAHPQENLEAFRRRFEPPPRHAFVAGFDAARLNIKQAMVAALLEHERLTLDQLRQTLEQLGVRLKGVASLKRAWKGSPPIGQDSEGRLFLDRTCPEYLETRRRMQPYRGSSTPPKFLVKRFPLRYATAAEEPLDVVLVVEEPGGWVAAGLPFPRKAGAEVYAKAITEGVEKRGEPTALVVDDAAARSYLVQRFKFPVEYRNCLPELDHPYYSLDLAMGGSALAYPRLPREELEAFLTKAGEFYLAAPWRQVSDSELFEVRGLRRHPLYLSVLGNAGVFYGLGVVQDRESAFQLVSGGETVRPKVFLNYLDTQESFPITEWLQTNSYEYVEPEAAPYCFGEQGPAPAQGYTLITQLLEVVLAATQDGLRPGELNFELGGRSLQVIWPADVTTASVTPIRKPRRNDPCWCGSGKKYKKCHLSADS